SASSRAAPERRSRSHQLDRIAHREHPAAHDVAVERYAAAEAPVDAAQHVDVLLERVGVERRHDAPLPEIPDADQDVAHAQAASLPVALGAPLASADDEVRS